MGVEKRVDDGRRSTDAVLPAEDARHDEASEAFGMRRLSGGDWESEPIRTAEDPRRRSGGDCEDACLEFVRGSGSACPAATISSKASRSPTALRSARAT